jgi:ribosome biogenesis ATPase
MQHCEERDDSITKWQWVFPMMKPELSEFVWSMLSQMLKSSRIIRVMCSKLRLQGDFDFLALAKVTPGYVGADLAALTGAAGIIAVKRIFERLSSASPVPEVAEETTSMVVDADSAAPMADGTEVAAPITQDFVPKSAISRFLTSHPGPLSEAELEPLHVSFEDFISALQEVQPSAKREGFATVPDITWADVGALNEVRDELHMAIVQPIRRPELFARVGVQAPCGVLLWGPPGCGKTLLAKAVANESAANFISVKGPELLNKVRSYLIPNRDGIDQRSIVCRRE